MGILVDAAETRIVGYYVALYLLAVLGPLVPSILIYYLFPDTKVSTRGPLAGLTVRAKGAFAAYMIIFLLALTIVVHFQQAIGTFITPVWTVTAQISLIDQDDKEITDATLRNEATIEYHPEMWVNSFGNLKLKVPLLDDWPYLHIQVRGLGAVDLKAPFSEYEPQKDGFLRTINLRKRIEIKLNTTPYNEAGTKTNHK